MDWQINAIVIFLFAATGLSLLMVVERWRKRHKHTIASAQALLLLSGSIWNFSNAMMIASPGLELKMFWNATQFFGIASAPVAWVILVWQFIGHTHFLTRRNIILMSIFPALTVLAAFTNEYHGVIWYDIRLDLELLVPNVVTKNGPGLWLFYIYGISLYLYATLLLVRVLRRSRGMFLWQIVLLLVAAISVGLMATLDMSDIFEHTGIDLMPLGLAIGIILITFTFSYLRRADIMQVAQGAVIETMSDIVLVMDHDHHIIDINPAAERLFGQTADDVVGRPVEQLSARLYEKLDLERGDVAREVTLEVSGEDRTYDLLTSVRHWQDQPVFRVAVLHDVTARKHIEERLRASLHEKEVLLKEIHHRVKNNLQIISSLLNLQASLTDDEQTLAAFRDSQSRVSSMALVHERLYQSPDLASVAFDDYVRDLLHHLTATYHASGVNLKVEAGDLRLDIDTAITCGLIINELVSNAFKHAFPAGRAGEIGVLLQPEDNGRCAITVYDDGVGLPDGFVVEDSDSLGLRLVLSLTRQLDGTLEVFRKSGTAFVIRFDHPSYEDSADER